MGNKTEIAWCDSTHNEWEGCTKVGLGCDHCYAENRNARFGGGEAPNWGPGAPRRLTSVSNRGKPLLWNKRPFYECAACGWRGDKQANVFMACPHCDDLNSLKDARRRVFSASLSDWLDNEVPIEWLVGLLDTIRQTPNLDWLLLTKRIGNWVPRLNLAEDFISKSDKPDRDLQQWIIDWLQGKPPAHVWLGITVVNQTEADRDILKLLDVPARIRFLSMEPLLGLVDLYRGGFSLLRPLHAPPKNGPRKERIHWVIAGGESGKNARPMASEWVRSLRDQTTEEGVAFLFKQWGEWLPAEEIMPLIAGKGPDIVGVTTGAPARQRCELMARVGKDKAGNMLDGRRHLEFPC